MWLSTKQHINRNVKFSLVLKIDNIFLDIIELVFQASISEKNIKYNYVKKSLIKLDILKLFIKILWETRFLDNKKYINISIPLTEIGKMLGAWHRNLKS